mmetsp:Transcript_255/g.755  ORF Transcript_255/g.755 Transcript_255/m.755 type:complete len:247 (-) Transcript_255:384-1124(-)
MTMRKCCQGRCTAGGRPVRLSPGQCERPWPPHSAHSVCPSARSATHRCGACHGLASDPAAHPLRHGHKPDHPLVAVPLDLAEQGIQLAVAEEAEEDRVGRRRRGAKEGHPGGGQVRVGSRVEEVVPHSKGQGGATQEAQIHGPSVLREEVRVEVVKGNRQEVVVPDRVGQGGQGREEEGEEGEREEGVRGDVLLGDALHPVEDRELVGAPRADLHGQRPVEAVGHGQQPEGGPGLQARLSGHLQGQ